MTIGDIMQLVARERVKWLRAFEDGLMDVDELARINSWIDWMRGMATEWAVYVDSLPDYESMEYAMLSA